MIKKLTGQLDPEIELACGEYFESWLLDGTLILSDGKDEVHLQPGIKVDLDDLGEWFHARTECAR